MSSAQLTTLLFGITGLLALTLVTLVALKKPWLATSATLVSLAFVPFWVGGNVSAFFVSAHLVLMALSSISIVANRLAPISVHIVDLLLIGVLGITAVALVPGVVTLHQLYVFLQWILAYWFARLAAAAFGLQALFTVVSRAFPWVALAMIAERLTQTNLWHSYARLDNATFYAWGRLQYRGGVLRAEGPFGHSIAAGSVLAVMAVLSLDAKRRLWVRIGAIALMAVGVGVTISRISLITFALGILLAVVLARTNLGGAAKAAMLAALFIGTTALVVVLRDVLTEAGSEASNSASYRLWLLDLVPTLNPLGYAHGFSRGSTGSTSFGAFKSVDSAVLFYALTNGWIPAIILVALLGAAVVQLLRLRGGVATAALVAQIPGLFAVALITSYSLVFWFVAGLAVAEATHAATRRRETITQPPVPRGRSLKELSAC